MAFAGLSAQIANRAKRRNFEQQVLCQAGDLLQAGLRFTRNLASAEHLVQQTMLRAWYEFESSGIEPACRVWLFKVMLNFWNCDVQANSNASCGGLQQEKTRVGVLNAQTSRGKPEVKNAVDHLSDDLRVVLLLFSVERFSCTEISEILAIPIDTVISNLAVARNLVKGDLGVRPFSRAAG